MKRVLRRILPLALLGSAVALVLVQLSRAVAYEVDLQLDLAPEVVQKLDNLEITVVDAEDEKKAASVVIFRFDSSHPSISPLRHTMRLTGGKYLLFINLLHAGRTQLVRRSLQVSSKSSVRIHLP